MPYDIIRNYRAPGVIGIFALFVPVKLFSHVSLSEVGVSKQREEGGEQLVEGTDEKRRGTWELLCICRVPWRHCPRDAEEYKGHPFINRLPYSHPPRESLSHIAWSYMDCSFSAQLLGAGLFWNSLKENNHNLQHHYHPQIEWDCSISTFPPHHHNILMRRSESATDWEVTTASPAQWWGQRERQRLKKSKQISKTVFLPVCTSCSFDSLLVDDFGFWIKALPWQPKGLTIPQKCQGLGHLLDVRVQEEKTPSGASESLLSSEFPSLRISFQDSE